MAQLVASLDADTVRSNLGRVRREIAASGRDPKSVEILVAVKYLPAELLPQLAEGGVSLVGENRAQELKVKAAAHPGMFTWDFIGQLQSRKVKLVLPLVRYIHSVASDSALREIGRHGTDDTRILVEVNVGGEAGKGGIAPDQLEAFLARSPAEVVGLMTMPPQTEDAEASRLHFARLRELAQAHGLRELSMGTTQDWRVAVEEGATIIRLGSGILAPAAS